MVRARTEQPYHTDAALETDRVSVQIVYHVPNAKVFQRFARQIGAQMSELSSDAGYSKQTVVDGLAHFLTVVAELLAKRLNSRT